jgi:hypothetical protein
MERKKGGCPRERHSPQRPEPPVRRSRSRRRRVRLLPLHPLLPLPAPPPSPSLPSSPFRPFTDACALARGHQGEDSLPHSSVDAPAFEQRGNAVSATAPPRTLLVMPTFVPGWEAISCRCRRLYRHVCSPAHRSVSSCVLPVAVALMPSSCHHCTGDGEHALNPSARAHPRTPMHPSTARACSPGCLKAEPWGSCSR